MYIRELNTFITVADQGSFLKAAQKLYTTPASVMNQMNKLECLIGAKLLVRTNQGTSLTAAGHSVYRDAKQMIDFAENAVKKAQRIADSERNQIRIGTSILRPCKRLIDIWNDIDTTNLPFQISIIPFDDDPAGLASVFSTPGKQIDCFIGPCDSVEWQTKYHILVLDHLPCRIAVPRKHRLAGKKVLCWSDLDGENFIIGRRWDSPVLDRMWDDILANHPNINIIDISGRYDTSIFNRCEQMNYLMGTLDIWADIHPALVTLPMDWTYEIPYGIICKPTDRTPCERSADSKKASTKSVTDFVEAIRNAVNPNPSSYA